MPAQITKVACQSCGANLSIDESIRFVTCGYCSAQLEIVHDPSTTHSKLLEDVVKRQDAVEDELRVLRLEKQIQRLDREWEGFRKRVSSRGKDGDIIEPSKGSAMMIGFFGIVIGSIILVSAIQAEDRLLLILLALAVVFAAVAIARQGIRRAGEFAMMHMRYLQKRTQLKGELASAERGLRMKPMKRSGTPS